MIEISTARLYGRSFDLNDVDQLLPFHSDPLVVRYIPWPIRTRADVVDWVKKFQDHQELNNEGDYLTQVIIRREDDQLIGQVNAMYRSAEHQHAEIGYVLNPAFGGRGYATEAVHALISSLFNTGRFHRVTAHIDDRNLASVALVERLGLRREAHFQDEEFFKGEWTSTYIYAVLRSEWEGRQGVG